MSPSFVVPKPHEAAQPPSAPRFVSAARTVCVAPGPPRMARPGTGPGPRGAPCSNTPGWSSATPMPQTRTLRPGERRQPARCKQQPLGSPGPQPQTAPHSASDSGRAELDCGRLETHLWAGHLMAALGRGNSGCPQAVVTSVLPQTRPQLILAGQPATLPVRLTHHLQGTGVRGMRVGYGPCRGPPGALTPLGCEPQGNRPSLCVSWAS